MIACVHYSYVHYTVQGSRGNEKEKSGLSTALFCRAAMYTCTLHRCWCLVCVVGGRMRVDLNTNLTTSFIEGFSPS